MNDPRIPRHVNFREIGPGLSRVNERTKSRREATTRCRDATFNDAPTTSANHVRHYDIIKSVTEADRLVNAIQGKLIFRPADFPAHGFRLKTLRSRSIQQRILARSSASINFPILFPSSFHFVK